MKGKIIVDKSLAYLDNAIALLNQVKQTQADVIDDAARMMFDCYKKGGSLFVFGASHAGIIAEEMFYRAGGLMIANPIFNPTLMLNTRPVTITSDMERLEGFGGIILEKSPIKPGDLLIIHSVSGRNSVTIDMALAARAKGIQIIVITSMEYTNKVPSRHSSGKLLYELGDIVIDNCGVYGDACIEIGDAGIVAGPTSTFSGAVIANMLSVGFAELCDANGIDPPVYISANLDVDKTRTEKVLRDHSDRIHYL